MRLLCHFLPCQPAEALHHYWSKRNASFSDLAEISYTAVSAKFVKTYVIYLKINYDLQENYMLKGSFFLVLFFLFNKLIYFLDGESQFGLG